MNDKDKELMEYKEAARSEAEEVNRLQTENKKLREALEHIYETSDDYDSAKYAREELMEYKEAARSEAEEVNRLQAENKKLREALEFYADRNNWKFESYSRDCKEVIDFSDLGCRSYTDEADFACSSGGRRAREALKEVGKE
jgi:regulator of replication initiation timing